MAEDKNDDMEVDVKNNKNEEGTDKKKRTTMADIEQICAGCDTPMLRCKCNHRPPPGLSTASASTAVQPQMVQDPLHTGLAQSVQTACSNNDTIRINRSTAAAAAAASTTTETYDPQRMCEGYIEDEFLRNGELITAAHSTRNRRAPDIPSWHTLSTATGTAPVRALLTALAFDLETTDPWNSLGLSELEGPTPSTHMLESRRDVAVKILESCTPALSESALKEISTIKDKLIQACDECCANLKTNARERRNLKGSIRNIPRWMEPSEDILEYLATHMPHNGRLAMHLSNLRGINITNHKGAVDVNTSRQLHSHLCGPPDEIERTLIRWGDLPLLTWAPIDNGQLLKVAACARKLQNTKAYMRN